MRTEWNSVNLKALRAHAWSFLSTWKFQAQWRSHCDKKNSWYNHLISLIKKGDPLPYRPWLEKKTKFQRRNISISNCPVTCGSTPQRRVVATGKVQSVSSLWRCHLPEESRVKRRHWKLHRLHDLQRLHYSGSKITLKPSSVSETLVATRV